MAEVLVPLEISRRRTLFLAQLLSQPRRNNERTNAVAQRLTVGEQPHCLEAIRLSGRVTDGSEWLTWPSLNVV